MVWWGLLAGRGCDNVFLAIYDFDKALFRANAFHQSPFLTGGLTILGTCHDVVPRGFVCECPSEYNGPRCQLTTRTFSGSSYIWLPPKTPHNFGRISLEFETGAADGLLLYQGPAVKGNNN